MKTHCVSESIEKATTVDIVATAELKTPDGTYQIVERRRTPRLPSDVEAATPSFDFASSPQMMGLGGLIIIGVLIASYTTKYDASIGHAGGAIAVPSVGFLALQLFLARGVFRLLHDIHTFPNLAAYVQSRLLRYLPATIPAVLLGYVVIETIGYPGAHANAAGLPINMLMLADMVGADEIDSSHWRLKIELMQSALVAMLWFSPMRRHMALLFTIGLAISAACMTGEPARHNVLTVQGFVTCDGYLPLFVFGGALYHLLQAKRSSLWWCMLGVAGLLSMLSNGSAHWLAMVIGLVVLALVASGYLGVIGRLRALILLGRIAFPIYVVHFVTGFAMIHSLELHGCSASIASVLTAILAIAIGWLFNIAFERPAERHGPAVFRALGRSAASVTLWTRTPAFGATAIETADAQS